ncbi:hypothetical protein ACPOL_1234 [Acidisarcina polymorpha]|uniref:Uncharacterized protein n=1 Tax=Acidisarcina polymorpha TaxID=2211140 RepID=A0A2Z5FV06_9BACT|nr:hypothetical protein ACPOL_1234 [Acidisarcina polymorpha]
MRGIRLPIQARGGMNRAPDSLGFRVVLLWVSILAGEGDGGLL